MKRKNWDTLVLVAAAVASVALLLLIRQGHAVHWLWLTLGTCVLVTLATRAVSPLFETSMLPTILLIASIYVPVGGLVWSAPLVGWTLAVAAQRTGSRAAAILAIAVSLAWIAVPDGVSNDAFRMVSLVTVAANLLFCAVQALGRRQAVGIVDVVVCSYTSNTAHFAQQFAEGVEKAGAKANIHRYHYTSLPIPTLSGDALVVAYPTIGWNPPYTMFDLILDLPRGRGRPAYVLYTSAGGPENAFFLSWLLLLCKGYRPMGRLGGTYPGNVMTIRIGPKRMWRWLDTLLPRNTDLRLAHEAGEQFVRGIPEGLPFWLWPSPLFILNFPLIFKLLNRYIWWPYVRKSRCNKCNLCVRACPTGRIKGVEGSFPISSGPCVLCYGCVNLCPTDALQAVALTEYGQRYEPRWPNLVVRNKPRKRSEDK